MAGGVTKAAAKAAAERAAVAKEAAAKPSGAPRFGAASKGARSLRWARALFYGGGAPVLLYAMYVQLIVLKGAGRTPIPASVGFGRDSVLLTFHGNLHCTWYAVLCLLHAVVALRRGSRGTPEVRGSRLLRFAERATHTYTAPLFALGGFVGLAYYGLLHFLPITRLRARMIPDYDEKMALLHLGPLLFVAGDVLLKDADLSRRHGMSRARAQRAIVAYGTLYFGWSVFCVRMNGGHWPYPFQPHLSATQHVLFVSSVMVFACFLARKAVRLTARLDRNRRRRIVARERADERARASAARRRASAAHAVAL